MHKSNIILVSTAFIFVFFVGLLAIGQNYFKVTKTIAGVSTEELPQIQLKTLPQRHEGSSDPQILAKAAYLIDVDSATPLFSKNENEVLPIASTTKIATALVVIENYSDKLNDIVAITPKMNNVEETRIGLLSGEKISVQNLLYGLLINSGNDAAYALGVYFGGLDKFVAEMNNKVWQIGLKDTQYYDPAGLDDRGHSNSRELAILGAYALRNKQFSEIVKIPEKTVCSVDLRYAHDLINSNRLVRPEEPLYLPYAIGVKTGFTYEAGHVLVSAAEKEGHRILAVVLNTYKDTKPASAEESKKLLEWGFNNWTWTK